jgi:hypothetical protein
MPSKKPGPSSRKPQRQAFPILPPAALNLEQLAAFANSSENELEETAEEALQLITPPDDQRTRCRQSIKDRIAIIRAMHFKKDRSTAEIRDDINKLSAALRRTVAALRKLFINGSELHLPMRRFNSDEIVRSMVNGTEYQSEWREFYNVLVAKIDLLENRYNDVRKAGPVSDPAKLLAALHSSHLLREFGRRPTKTVGGAFYELASLLYEGATGVQNANLERYCRKILEHDAHRERRFPNLPR